MLNLNHITLDIQDGNLTRRLLDHVSLSVNPGEVVGLTGPSGSGKSTLLAVAAGLQKPTSGTATLGDSIDLINGGARTRREHVGIVFQQPNLLPSLTAQEQLQVMARLDRPWGLRRAQWRATTRRAAELLERVGLGDKTGARVSELSGGQQARVNLARALMNQPDVLLVDEPTAALDSDNASLVTELITGIAREDGIPVLYVSHDQEQLTGLDRVVEIVDGRVLQPTG
ncbi:ATP-binding cassette domain-containing protein [Corynebacterium sp. zg254]|uniref:ABC transporter ATP-binding protein n=1 Tax=Corynebacterium zhongnanshanii TaxID=2768834 RepID=A0ABQ6VFZ4_9CORY|nr:MULTISPECIES: ABC transporter ATP-binding protein [Corynebacterium]KAB3523342.1 ABC transporter ATP-binding protein [Corynebacterium zhongnanshanii]MCR5913536.1 ATP-binding cassette domain-containing protein [Corynebacterium sp. zg254]